MAEAYATREDVYLCGLPRGSLSVRPRVVASVDVTTNRLEVTEHGCELDTPITFRVAGDGALAAPLTAAVYYARPVDDTDDFLEVAATPGGPAVDLTTQGDPMMLVIRMRPMLDRLLEVFSRWVDSLLIAHTVPLTAPFPPWVTYTVAVRAAAQAARALGLGTQADKIFDAEEKAIVDALRLAKGSPLRDELATPASNLALGRTPAGSTRWGSCDPEVIP